MNMITYSRNQSGFSLVPIIAIAVIAALWLLAMVALVMPSYQKVVQTKKANALRTASESSLDWAVSQLNQRNVAFDPPAGGFVRLDVPAAVIDSCGAFATTNPPISTIYVYDQAPPSTMTDPPSTYTSYVYDPYFDPNTTHPTVAPTVAQNGWRRVVARTVWGDAANPGNVKTVQVILKPNYMPSAPVAGAPLPPRPYFQFGLFGGQSVGLTGHQTVDAFDSRDGSYGGSNVLLSQADVGTNGSISLVGGSHIYGDVIVSNPVADPNNASDPGYTTETATGSGGPRVEGRLVDNGSVSGFDASNVAGGVTSGYQGGSVTPVQELPPTPQPPAHAHALGDINLSGRSTMTLRHGDYTASSISISGRGQIIIDASAGPVNIYMVGAGNITVGGNGIYNGSGVPSNLRIWNASSAPTTLGGNGDLSAVVYAPNSAVSLSGNGSIYGAVVGNTVSVTGGGTSGGFHYDVALRSAALGLTYQPPAPTATALSTLSNLQTVSWQEVDWDMTLP
jgi:type II secretory pathway pseudopilin PulG